MRNFYYRSLALFVCFLPVFPMTAASPDVVISQVYGGWGNSGAQYKNDFIELYNTGSSAVTMTNWQVAYASATGTSWSYTTFSGNIPSHGYFLIQEAAGTGTGAALPTPDVTTGTVNLSATTGKVALLNDNVAIGAVSCPTTKTDVVDFLGYGTANCAEGTVAAAPSNTTSLYRVSNTDTDRNSVDFGTEAPNPHNSGSAASTLSLSSLTPSTASAGGPSFTLTIAGSGFTAPATVNFNGTPLAAATVTATQITVTVPASSIASGGTDPVSVTSNGATSSPLNFTVSAAVTCNPTHTIAEIQGSGDTSSYATTSQSASGIVTHLRSSGFFMQMAIGDGDPTTSDGIYVFTSSAPTVTTGDAVCVSGTIQEYSAGSTTDPINSLTEIAASGVTRISSGNALPAAVEIGPSPTGATDQLERYEGMRVSISSSTVTGPTDATINEANSTAVSSGSFYVVASGNIRPFREPGVEVNHPIAATLPSCCIPLFDANPERVEIYTGDPGVTRVDVAVGASIAGISGVLDVYYGDYELDVDPSATLSVSNNNSSFTAVPAPLATQLTVGTFNLERFYDSSDDPNTSDVVLTPTALAGRLKKASLAIRNVLHTPDILGVEEMENLSNLQALAAQISSDAIAAGQTDPQYTAFLSSGNDIGGINVGFLVNPSRVSGAAATQYGLTTTYTDPTSGSQAILNDRPPLVLTGSAHNGGSVALPVTVIVNHLKALPADDPTDTRVRVKRNAQAVYLANLIQSFQNANPSAPLVSVGDYNAFEFNDGLTDVLGTVEGTPAASNQDLIPASPLVNPTLTELSSAYLPANQRYSYVESGNAQQLDHVVVNPPAYSRLAQFAIGHLNADFPVVLRNDITRPERISDHDAEVAYFTLPAALDVTSSVSASSSGLVLNRATGIYSGTVTVTNRSGSSIAGPIQIALSSLAAGVTLVNASGNLAGTPYIASGAASLAPNASVSVGVQFRVTGSARVAYSINTWSGTL
jgi:predicted extracellular nuclease